jgi:NADH dehydrogenase
VPEKVVILGAGFAGLNVARHLERYGRRGELAVTIVNRENYMLFTPMLPEVSSGSIEPRHITPPLRAILRTASFELGDVSGVDFDARTVAVTKRRDGGDACLPFDHLVVALGAENSTHGVPGAQEHTFPLKTVHDAVVLRDVTITALENAAIARDDAERGRCTTFVVVGGGFTGVEAAGELLAFLRSASRFYPHVERSDIRVVLVAGTDRLLEQLSPDLGQHATAMLERRGVEVVFSDQAASVDAGGITLCSGKRFATRCVIWSAGEQPSSLLEHFELKRSEHGAIDVHPDLSAIGTPGVWALGDCAHIPKPGGGAYPQTAQHAVHEAHRLARNLLATVRGRPTKPYVYRARGMMASIGAHEGLAEIGGHVKLFGLPAWLLWRTYYLGQLPGYDRKARVVLDWTLDFPFPQDIASVR